MTFSEQPLYSGVSVGLDTVIVSGCKQASVPEYLRILRNQYSPHDLIVSLLKWQPLAEADNKESEQSQSAAPQTAAKPAAKRKGCRAQPWTGQTRDGGTILESYLIL